MAATRHSLHRAIVFPPEHRLGMESTLAAWAQPRALSQSAALPDADTVAVALSTVSIESNFDAYVGVRPQGAAPNVSDSLVVDSGNSTLIMPYWEKFEAMPQYKNAYEELGDAHEPWGCPAKVLRGPIELTTDSGASFVISDCVFYACVGGLHGVDKDRTANFGAACLSQYRISSWTVDGDVDVTMQAPLAYAAEHPYVEFEYAAAHDIVTHGATPKMAANSYMILHKTMPAGYRMFDIVPAKAWMTLLVKSLVVDGQKTRWPDPVPQPLAVVDTGGTCAFLSDPKGYLYPNDWVDRVGTPCWTDTSVLCQAINGTLRIELGDKNASYSYKIDPLPHPAASPTLVMCRKNDYMRDLPGLNIGGISALMNSILIDFKNAKVGFKGR